MIDNVPIDLALSSKEFMKKYNRSKTACIITLGCKVNSYESDAMSELFQKDGYLMVNQDEFADVYVINTCTVTNLGDRKSRQLIRRGKKINPNSIIAVVGCYSQIAPEDIMEIQGVNLIVGTNERKRIVELIRGLNVDDQVCLVGDIMKVKEFEELTIYKTTERTRAFIKIQDGCNQFCSYCIIPFARGAVRSREPENVLSEVRRIANNGFKEIVITGIHVASYGNDLKNITLMDILKQIDDIDGIERIRLSSLEPRLMTDEFIYELSKLKKFCNHFHLSLQSGSDAVLKRMNRKYDTDEYISVVDKIKEKFENPSFTTDVIVGFPGETNEEFQETLEFVKRVGFHQLHVFKYSPKKGTPAAIMKNQIHGDIKSLRSEQLILLSKIMENEYVSSFIGKEISVLFEDTNSDGSFEITGHSRNYMRVNVVGSMQLIGSISNVIVEKNIDGVLKGRLVNA